MLRILFVANHNTGSYSPFVLEQANAVKQKGLEIDFYGVHGKGITGYLSNLRSLKEKIREFNPDLIHAHYGLSGLLANLQRTVPVITTYHGSDIHSGGRNLIFSRMSIWLSEYNIFVSKQLQKRAGGCKNKQCILPCGIDTSAIFPIERTEARRMLGWDTDGKFVLFAGAFDNQVKNSSLAQTATALIPDARLIELRGYSRKQVNNVMNATNCLLMTSHREGSPQVIKEALACGTPIVSVAVGDVKDVITGVEGCYIATNDAQNVAVCLRQALAFEGKTNGPHRVVERNLSNELVGKRLVDIYNEVLKKK